jgi:hypothetical protein
MTKLTKRLEIATVLVVLGVIAQSATALSNHPLAFLAFIFIASPITLAGTVIYLVALIRED